MKHFAGTFTIGCGDDRGVDVMKTVFHEKLVDSIRRSAPHAEYGTKTVGSGPQMSDCSQKFKAMAFFLQRVIVIASSEDFNILPVDLIFLTGAGRLRQDSP